LSVLHTIPRHHRCPTSSAFCDIYGSDDCVTMRDSATVLAVEDYTNKYNVRVVMRVCGVF
jgi:hypothetical protein